MTAQGVALRAGAVQLLYYIPYSFLRFNKPRAAEVFYITPRYVPGLRGVLLIYELRDFEMVGEHFVKNGVTYKLFLPLKGPL